MRKRIVIREKLNLTEYYFINEAGNKNGIYKVYYNVNNFMYFERILNNNKSHGIQQRYCELKKIRYYIQTNINDILSGVYIKFNYK